MLLLVRLDKPGYVWRKRGAEALKLFPDLFVLIKGWKNDAVSSKSTRNTLVYAYIRIGYNVLCSDFSRYIMGESAYGV